MRKNMFMALNSLLILLISSFMSLNDSCCFVDVIAWKCVPLLFQWDLLFLYIVMITEWLPIPSDSLTKVLIQPLQIWWVDCLFHLWRLMAPRLLVLGYFDNFHLKDYNFVIWKFLNLAINEIISLSLILCTNVFYWNIVRVVLVIIGSGSILTSLIFVILVLVIFTSNSFPTLAKCWSGDK